ncbi:NADPH:quinone reductase [Streptomyces cellulosae]|uniref:NADPH2:quinone reductase n=1 Tax=Streptomyces thermodiastaticus TaxID=44061 RepID=A0ABU0KI34_9ACTN|nr:NADPH2:quinone reductase [Streptomyces thermodiastaticus]UVT13025.1 NADPH:quinone reductase [Streptomyces thermocarboxydus]WSB44850.1 NADPH:quinone reductase [Streptomyces cellulosae]WSB94611.1 NADPH:quinone reductase [Streptomyces cellulosae]WTF23855.1 NADPH:quinone reductase [Streptomyces cellulosae]
MRAAFYDTPGPARSVLRVIDVERPEPGPGQVRVRVTLSAVNPGDMYWRQHSTERDFQRVGKRRGRIPHQDGTGVIDAVGEGVDASRVGDRVWIWMAASGEVWGTAAEWVVVPSEQAVDLPDGASDALGACLGIPAMTAHLTLHGDGPLHGRTVLVAGGAGAVGHYAIELGKAAGATVVTTVSGSEKATHAKAAGADLVVNYRDPDAARQILDGVGPVDRIVEVALRDNLELDLAVAAPGATVVTYAAQAEDPSLPVLRLMWSHLTLRFTLFHTAPRDTLLHAADALTAALGEGALTPLPLHTFGLDEVAAAHEAVEHGVLGKAVLDLR